MPWCPRPSRPGARIRRESWPGHAAHAWPDRGGPVRSDLASVLPSAAARSLHERCAARNAARTLALGIGGCATVGHGPLTCRSATRRSSVPGRRLNRSIAAIRHGQFLAASVSTRRRQQADSRPADMSQVPHEARAAAMGCANRQVGRSVSSVGRQVLRSDRISVCSEISKTSSTSMPRYLTVDSSLRWPSNICMATQVLRASIDQRRFASPHRMRAVVCRIKTQFLDPMFEDSGVRRSSPSSCSSRSSGSFCAARGSAAAA